MPESLQNPGLVNRFSATPRGQLNRTGPIINSSEFIRGSKAVSKFVEYQLCLSKQGSTPSPCARGSARPNPKMRTPDTENPSHIGFAHMLRGGSRPWSQTMVSEGARPRVRGRSEFVKDLWSDSSL